ncbi:hypothetical protein [Kordiimonas marina]|uniref:hypothetical protein n=1 Tax=Kordiimonas marina TaxID=2872312 RepID=UPI001FF603D5|nr:hypothetical protein [Kordiimonas marina]MCJ9427647.1 hypothetical protein [Kordiimonas marina]
MEHRKDLITVFGVWAGAWLLVQFVQRLLSVGWQAFALPDFTSEWVSLGLMSLGALTVLLLVLFLWRGFRFWMVAAFLLFDLGMKLAGIWLNRIQASVYRAEAAAAGMHHANAYYVTQPFSAAFIYVAYMAGGYALALMIYWPFREPDAADESAEGIVKKQSGFQTFVQNWFSVLAGLAAASVLAERLSDVITVAALTSGVPWRFLMAGSASHWAIPVFGITISIAAGLLMGCGSGYVYGKYFKAPPFGQVIGCMLILMLMLMIGPLQYLISSYLITGHGPGMKWIWIMALVTFVPLLIRALAFWLSARLSGRRVEA